MLKADPNTKVNMIRLPFILLHRTDRGGASGPPKEVISEHSKQVMTLLKEGTIRAAGPFTESAEGSDLIGVLVFAEMPLEKAQKMVDQDAMVRGGYARVEPHVWFVADEVIPKKVAGHSPH
jgi:uncharacterized protein YciI